MTSVDEATAVIDVRPSTHNDINGRGDVLAFCIRVGQVVYPFTHILHGTTASRGFDRQVTRCIADITA